MLEAVTVEADPQKMNQLNLLGTPSLRAVTLRGRTDSGNLDSILSSLPLHWDHLTYLSIECDGMFIDTVPTVLGKCSRLVCFRYAIFCPPVTAQQSTRAPVLLPSLQTFIILGRPSNLNALALELLLRELQMPQLRHFEAIKVRSLLGGMGPASLGDFALRSPLIKELTLDVTYISPDSLAFTLRHLPALERLTAIDFAPVMNVHHTEHLLQLLSTAPLVCPALTSLYLRWCPNRDSVAALLAFAHMRLDYGVALRRISIKNANPCSALMDSVLQPLRDQGLEIVMSTQTPIPKNKNKPSANPWTGLPELHDQHPREW
jgi:hypothetical protein